MKPKHVLIACPTCSAQYDVTDCVLNQIIHCGCGHVLKRTVPEIHHGRLVKCPNCGGTTHPGDTKCAYCSSTLSLSDKGWGSMCPKCYVRLPVDAKFCVTCGTTINPQKVTDQESKLKCPRCECGLKFRQMEALHVDECGMCGGLWTPIESFEAIVEMKQDAHTVAKGFLGSKRKGRRMFELSSKEQVKYIPCPVCSEMMNRRNFGQTSGVIIDSCREHGVWLDNQELARIVKYLEEGGAEMATRYQAQQREMAPFTPLTAEEMRQMRRPQGLMEALGSVIRFLGT